MADERSFLFGYFFGRDNKQADFRKPFRRTRPKMPSGPWRLVAIVSFGFGAMVTWALLGTNASILRVAFGGLIVMAIGLWCAETWWERRVADSERE